MVENLSKNKQDGGIYKEEEDNVAFIRWWSPGWTTSKHVETTLETFYDCQQTPKNRVRMRRNNQAIGLTLGNRTNIR